MRYTLATTRMRAMRRCWNASVSDTFAVQRSTLVENDLVHFAVLTGHELKRRIYNLQEKFRFVIVKMGTERDYLVQQWIDRPLNLDGP